MTQHDPDPADGTSDGTARRAKTCQSVSNGPTRYSPMEQPQGLCQHCNAWGYQHVGRQRWCPTDALGDALEAASALVALVDRCVYPVVRPEYKSLRRRIVGTEATQ